MTTTSTPDVGTRRTSAWTSPRNWWFIDSHAQAIPVLVVFSWIAGLMNLGASRLMSMEPMVIHSAQQMLEHGDWAVPRLYGEIYTFKPALAAWFSAAVQSLTAEPSEWLLRLPFALSGVLLGWVLYAMISGAISPRAGLLTALAAMGNPLFLEKVRIAEFDVLLVLGVGVATAAAAVNLSRDNEHLGLWALAYVGLVFGCLAKGSPALMAFAPGLVVAAFLTQRQWRLLGWRHLLCVFVAGVTLLGYLYWAQLSSEGNFLRQPMHEAELRGFHFTATSLLASLAKPAVIVTLFAPFSFALLLWRPFFEDAHPRTRSLTKAAAGFVFAGLVVFSILPATEARYYLPLTTAFALLSGPMLSAAVGHSVPSWLTRSTQVLFVLLAVLVLGSAWQRGTDHWALLLVSLVALGLLVLTQRRATGTGLATQIVALAMTVAIAQALVFVPNRSERRDLSGVANQLQTHVPKGQTVLAFGPADCTGKMSNLLYYLDRDVRTLDDPAGLTPGGLVMLQGPQAQQIPPQVEFEVLAQSEGHLSLRLVRVVSNEAPAAPERLSWKQRVGSVCQQR